MSWLNSVPDLAKRLQVPMCSNPGCDAGGWQRLQRRKTGVFLNGRWFCNELCIQSEMDSLLMKLYRIPPTVGPSAHRLPLGLLMLSRGVIDEAQQAAALEMKRRCPDMRLGECMRTLRFADEEEITRALGAQGCLPVLLGYEPEQELLVPVSLQETSEVLCFRNRHTAAVLYAGFASAPDISFVRAVERMLQVEVASCIIPASLVHKGLATLRERFRSAESVFDSPLITSEIVRIVCSYARQAEAEWIRVAGTARYIWVRMQGKSCHDLLFGLHCTQ